MKPERWERVKELHARALELPAEEVSKFLATECGDDLLLRAEIDALLAVDVDSEGFLETPDHAPASGDVGEEPLQRLGDYDLLEKLGSGGFGVVYRARDRALARDVAIKVLPPKLTLTERDVERFQREARAIAKLRHPNIVRVFSVGREGEVNYFAMDLVRGSDLRVELQKRTAGEPGRLPSDQRAYLREAIPLLIEAADALHHAHENGIVHRDVKPANLLIDETGRAQVVDFGLARDERFGSLTRSGEQAGTPLYMSPEQIETSLGKVDHRTDVYSLGVVMYELLTLQRPFRGSSYQELVAAVVRKQPVAPRKLRPDLPRDLATICTKAMEKAVEDRYPDAAALRDDLQRWRFSAASGLMADS